MTRLATASAVLGPPAMMTSAEPITASAPTASPPRWRTSTRVASVLRSAPWTMRAEALLTANPADGHAEHGGGVDLDGARRRPMLSTITTAAAATSRTALASAPILSSRWKPYV